MHVTKPSRFALTGIALALAAALLSGCSGDDDAGSATGEAENPRMIQRDTPDRNSERTAPTVAETDQTDFSVMPDVEGSAQEEGLGLETVINAGSKQDYAQSLKWIAEDTSREQFERLETSIRFIHMYDAQVFGNESKLLEAIDGKTGNEIIAYADAMIQQRREQREQSGGTIAVPQPDGT